MQGEQVEFEDSVKIISPYIDGVIHGYQSTYIHNNLYKRSYYNHGIKDSLEHFYDSLGNVVTTFEYYYDQDSNWFENLDLENRNLISHYSFSDTLTARHLKLAKCRGRILYYTYDPTGVGDASIYDVVSESITQDDCSDHYSLSWDGYYYIIDENSCIVCDYLNYDGIYIAYVGIYGSYGLEGIQHVELFKLEEK